MNTRFDELHRRAVVLQQEVAGLDAPEAVLVIVKALMDLRADAQREIIDEVTLLLTPKDLH